MKKRDTATIERGNVKKQDKIREGNIERNSLKEKVSEKLTC